jgi:DNA-binding PadR family transcriptional regulator
VRKVESADTGHFGGFIRPQGAPRGLLAYYILHSISRKPTHGYEILQDIESKTEGAWRPGAGSVYPILKKFFAEGYIKSSSTKKRVPTAQRVYEITPKGEECLRQFNEKISEVGRNWGSMRRIFMEFIKPEHLNKFLVDGTRAQFEIWQEIFESKSSPLPLSEVEYILKEYIIMLERQLDWSTSKLKRLRTVRQKVLEKSG